MRIVNWFSTRTFVSSKCFYLISFSDLSSSISCKTCRCVRIQVLYISCHVICVTQLFKLNFALISFWETSPLQWLHRDHLSTQSRPPRFPRHSQHTARQHLHHQYSFFPWNPSELPDMCSDSPGICHHWSLETPPWSNDNIVPFYNSATGMQNYFWANNWKTICRHFWI